MKKYIQTELQRDFRSLLTWIAFGLLFYFMLSGAFITWMPFDIYSQYSVIVHSVTGIAALLPVGIIVYLHWRRRDGSVDGALETVATSALVLLGICLLSGLVVTLQAALGTHVQAFWWTVHQLSSFGFAVAVLAHLTPILLRYRTSAATPRRLARRRYLAAAFAVLLVPFAATGWLSSGVEEDEVFQGFSDAYDFRFGEDRPFWPSRASIDGVPWRENLDARLASVLSPDEGQRLDATLGDQESSALGPLAAIEMALPTLSIDPDRTSMLHEALSTARDDLRSSGAIRTGPMIDSATCGSSGCHEQIYDEWLPSAHGFAAIDILFRDVQELLAEAEGSAETRTCAGCHDPVALLAGTRSGASIAGDDLVIHEGNSCLVCHSITSTDTEGNGGYTIQVPQHYLFTGAEGAGSFLNRFLIRGYPSHHISSFTRPIYKQSEFCAACHKQTKLASSETAIGLAVEQNEYDSWREGHWYFEDEPDRTLACRDCHMPLVDSSDPARGDSVDTNRSAGDGKHRSHRTLGGNTYIPVAQDLPGGEFQAEQTKEWLKGAIEINEIADRWTDGPVVDLSIVAPEVIEPGDLINLTLVMHNNKTGHDFPAGPLDLLASWIEIKVEDDQGRTLMHLGDPEGDKPTLDAPIVYKADWYDKRGLPVERHNIWEVVGASYKRSLQSGDVDVVDIPFRCPVIARPRISNSVSEDGPGQRKSDVVFRVENQSIQELTVTARVLYRKANPEFLAYVYSLDTKMEAPIIEMNRVTHKIRISDAH